MAPAGIDGTGEEAISGRSPRGRGRHADHGVVYNSDGHALRRLVLLILALDTTTRRGGVALLRDQRVLAETTGDPEVTHGQRLPADLMRTLEAAGVRLEDVALLAVADGPGSFTGLRVGIATMQGLAVARGLKVVPVSSLEALAHQAAGRIERTGALVAPWIDAQRGEVFAALYAPGAGDVVAPPSAATPEDTLRAWRGHIGPQPVVFTGDGAVRYRETIDEALGAQAAVLEPPACLAATIARLAAAHPERAVLPHAVVPVYVRRPDAELARERRSVDGPVPAPRR